jgi:hypothetical protein
MPEKLSARNFGKFKSDSPKETSSAKKSAKVSRKKNRGILACEDTSSITLETLRAIEKDLVEISEEIRELNPATIRSSKKPRRKKAAKALARDRDAQKFLDRFRADKPEPEATSALRLVFHNCGPGCMGCPHTGWAVWSMATSKKSLDKTPRRTLVKLTGQSALVNNVFARVKAGELPESALKKAAAAKTPRNPEEQARAAHLLQMRVFAYARQSPNPKTLVLVKRAYRLMEARRKIVETLSHLGRLARTNKP